jgi:hypothetical protein
MQDSSATIPSLPYHRLLSLQIVGCRKQKWRKLYFPLSGLIGLKAYNWGCEGVQGVRLNDIKIDRERIYLTFGNDCETMRVELLHGMTEKQLLLDVKQRLWRETGVAANIIGWQQLNKGGTEK